MCIRDRVYPGHGAGSACGKNMMKQTVDTLSNQKVVNYALNGSLTKEDFIKELTENLPEPPTYFPSNVKLNQVGYLDLDFVLEKSLKPLNITGFKSLTKENKTIILDVRSQDDFRVGYVPGSIFIGLNGGFAPWAGSVIKDINTKILLVCDPGLENQAIMRLSRVGFDNVIGYLDGGFEVWKKANQKIESIDSISPIDLKEIINSEISLIDVRKKNERDKGYLKVSQNIPLNIIDLKVKDLDKSIKHYVHCAGGYRSMIACSILKRLGFDSLFDVCGGFAEIKKIGLKIH